MGDALVARVDLKADRPARVLCIQAAWAEDGQALGLDRVDSVDRGDLAPYLRRLLA